MALNEIEILREENRRNVELSREMEARATAQKIWAESRVHVENMDEILSDMPQTREVAALAACVKELRKSLKRSE